MHHTDRQVIDHSPRHQGHHERINCRPRTSDSDIINGLQRFQGVLHVCCTGELREKSSRLGHIRGNEVDIFNSVRILECKSQRPLSAWILEGLCRGQDRRIESLPGDNAHCRGFDRIAISVANDLFVRVKLSLPNTIDGLRGTPTELARDETWVARVRKGGQEFFRWNRIQKWHSACRTYVPQSHHGIDSLAIRSGTGAILESVMTAQEGPETGSKVRVQVTVENRVSNGANAGTDSVVQFGREGGPRTVGLGVDSCCSRHSGRSRFGRVGARRALIVRLCRPGMSVQVEHVRLEHAGVTKSNLDRVALVPLNHTGGETRQRTSVARFVGERQTAVFDIGRRQTSGGQTRIFVRGVNGLRGQPGSRSPGQFHRTRVAVDP